MIIFDELGLDPAPVIGHFEEFLGKDVARPLIRASEKELESVFHLIDAVYSIQLDRQPEGWERKRRQFHEWGIERRVRRFPASDTPVNPHIGCALTHRRILAQKLRNLQSILVFEDEALVSGLTPAASEELMRSLDDLQDRELQGQPWQTAFLEGPAIAYHRSIFDAILSSIPDDPIAVARLVRPLEEGSGNTMAQWFRLFGLRVPQDEADVRECA
jgi:hypothetical protein